MMDVGVDIGGTFTDVAVHDPLTGTMSFGKVLTTPGDPSQGVADGLQAYGVDVGGARAFVHGTTIAINTVIERSGAKTALITTRGFRDVLEIARGNRPESFNIYFTRLDPLIPRKLRLEITERIDAHGEVLTPPSLEELDGIVALLEREQVEAVAICLINSYRNPAHERLVAQALRERWPGVICVSTDLSREFREYERMSTVAVNAYIAPKVQRYLGRLQDVLAERGFSGPFYVVESNAGLSSAAAVQARPCYLMESGPVAGVIGSARVGELLGLRNLVAFDMGGTTAKTCLVLDGVPPTTDAYYIGGYGRGHVLQVPVLDMVEVGAGGGSLAWTDEVGAIHVGPRSAGAEPGPACYGRGGTEPTVTDANLLLGRLNEHYFAGGRIRLDRAAAETAVREALGDRFGLTVTEAAAGIIDLANLTMAEAVRLVTIRRGRDPRDFAMVAYGGGGPVHACAIARDLSIPLIVVPPAPGNFSAAGMLLMDFRRDYMEMLIRPLDGESLPAMVGLFQRLESHAREELQVDARAGVQDIRFQRMAEMRFRGQSSTVKVPLGPLTGPDALADCQRRFREAYAVRYGHDGPQQTAEVVSVRVVAHGLRSRANTSRLHAQAEPESAQPTQRPVYFKSAGGFVDCPVVMRGSLAPGRRLTGPAVIEEPSSTTIVEPEDQLEVDEHGYLLLHLGLNG